MLLIGCHPQKLNAAILSLNAILPSITVQYYYFPLC